MTATRTHGLGAASAVLALALVASCGAGGSPSVPEGRDKVAFVPGVTGLGFYDALARSARAEADELGMRFVYQGASQFSPSAQIPVVRAVCARHPRILLVAPTDPVALRPAITSCVDAHIAVVIVDTGLADTRGVVSSISSADSQGGRAAADIMGKELHGTGQVGVLSLDPTSTTQVQRVRGFKQGVARYPGLSVAASAYTGGRSETAAEAAAHAVLSAHPELGGIFVTSEFSVASTAQAVSSEGKQGQIMVVGYDANPGEVSLLKSGKISALVVQQPASMGRLGVKYGYDWWHGKKSAIEKHVLLPNVTVTSSQAGSPEAEKFYYSSSAG